MDDVTRTSPRLARTSDPEVSARLGLDRPKARRTRLFAGLALIFLTAAAAFFLFQGEKPVHYLTQPAREAPLVVTVSATGTLAPRDQVDVGAEVSGRLDTVDVDFNDRVRKGQVLAQINTDQISTQLRQSRATLDQARATAAQAATTLGRTRRLAAEQAVAQQALDDAVADLDRANASVALATAQIDQLRTQLAKATIRSPIDGVVLDRKVEPGQTVVASLQAPVLFTLASDLSLMELDVDIDEADVGQVKIGQDAAFTVDAYPGRSFAAHLVSIHSSPRTVNGVVTYLGVLWVDNPDNLLKPGMTATADIRIAQVEKSLLVSNAALRFSPPKAAVANANGAATAGEGLSRVWIARDGRLEARNVATGLTDGRETQVLGGDIKVGDPVVTQVSEAGSEAAPSPSATSVLRNALGPRGGGPRPGRP